MARRQSRRPRCRECTSSPGPVTYVIQSIPTKAGKIIRLCFEHTTGSTVLLLDGDFARDMARQLYRSATGIELPGRF